MENKTLYIETVEGKLQFKPTEKNLLEYPRGLSSLIDKKEVEILHTYTKNIYYVKVRGSNKFYKIGFYDIVSSGSKTSLHKKRVQIPVWKQDMDLSELVSIGIYYYEPNVYVYFKNNEFLKNKKENINSLWLQLEPFVYAQRNKINFKYYPKFNININSDRRQEDFVVFNNFIELIKYIENPYSISDVSFLDWQIIDIKNEIHFLGNQLSKENGIQKNDVDLEIHTNQIIETTISNSSRFKKLQEKIKQYNLENFIIRSQKVSNINYIKTEELVYEMLLNDEEFQRIFLNKVKEKSIDEIDWKNKDKESYLPYDILVNDNVFIDVKATWKYKNETFYVSENEFNFKNNLLKNGLKYLIVLVSNLKESNEIKIELLDNDDIEKLEKRLQIIYIIEPFICVFISNQWYLNDCY